MRGVFVFLPMLVPQLALAVSATETVIHSFQRNGVDGTYSWPPLIVGTDGNLYSTTRAGGVYNFGTVFRITPAGDVTVIYSFAYGTLPHDGADPFASLLLGADGFFYGNTAGGGDNGQGTVFKVSSQGALTTLYAFGNQPDGNSPLGGLVQAADGTLFGTTWAGGGGVGSVFKISPTGQYQLIHSFGLQPASNDPIGYAPEAGLVQGPDGNFYGTTASGTPSLGGSVYKVTAQGQASVLHTFGNCYGDGYSPQAPLILGADGNFYGTTLGGGAHNPGTIFRITPGGDLSILYSFGSIPFDGTHPHGSLIQTADGSLLGTTLCGGDHVDPQDPNCKNRDSGGTAFMLSPSGLYTKLYSFGATEADAISPGAALVQAPDGNFYGTSEYGGAFGNSPFRYGTVFKLVLNPSGTAPTFQSQEVPGGCLPDPNAAAPPSGGGLRFWTLLPMLLAGLWVRPRSRSAH